MYYNAKESYGEAEKKRKETSQIDKNLYENSIKELSKILEFYPDSRWVDDALLMMGLCYLRQEDYFKAQRKFIELIKNYPASELVNQAKIHLAEVEIAMKNYEEARKLIENISTDNLDIEEYELFKLNAEMSLSLGDSTKALDQMIKASDEAKGTAEKITLMQASAKLAEKIGDYKTSARVYRQLSDLFVERENKFLSIVSYSQALNKLGQTDEAIKTLEEFTNNEEYALYSLNGDIKLAKFYLDKKDTIKTYKKLDEILRTSPKDKNNGAALSESAFYFGEYYFILKKDFISAVDMYDSSGYYDRKNEYYQKSVERTSLIREYKSLRRKIESFPGQKDSLVSKILRLETKIKMQNEGKDNYKNDLMQAQKQLSDLEYSNVSDKMTFAEKLFYELDLKDTAKVIFNELSKEYLFPHKASKALLTLIISDSTQYSQYEDTLLTRYPITSSANYIRMKRGLEPVMIIEDSAKYLFNISSQKFIDSLYTEAMNEYLDIGIKFNRSPLAPGILQAAGMIAENYIRNYEKAAEIYTVLLDKYPATNPGKFASKKLKKDGDKIEKVQKVEEKISDTEIWYQMDRRND
jgi:TolA-binding protein